MKKIIITLCSLFALVVSAEAQISITTNDIANPTHLIITGTDTLPTVSMGAAGANQTWDMTALAQGIKDTLTCMSYAWAPNPSYPTSNLVIKQGWRNQFAFAKNTSTSFEFLGQGGIINLLGYPTTMNQVNTPNEVVANFPFTFNSAFTCDYSSFAKSYFGHSVTYQGLPIMVDSIKDHSVTHKTVLVDAWGSLTTPMGTFPVIRSKEKKITSDTGSAYTFLGWTSAFSTKDSTTSYTYWTNGVGYPLVTATMDSSGAVKRVQWLMTMPLLGISELSTDNESVFPNPAQNEINFVSDVMNQRNIQVFDITGRKIDSYTINSTKTTINTSGYDSGMYIYEVLGKDESILKRGKFSINK